MFTGQNFWIRVSFVHHVEHGRETMWEKNTKKDANRILGTTNALDEEQRIRRFLFCIISFLKILARNNNVEGTGRKK